MMKQDVASITSQSAFDSLSLATWVVKEWNLGPRPIQSSEEKLLLHDDKEDKPIGKQLLQVMSLLV